jgi:murein DD-endopeptidase MepM/ murein hydrolase activator NlpD
MLRTVSRFLFLGVTHLLFSCCVLQKDYHPHRKARVTDVQTSAQRDPVFLNRQQQAEASFLGFANDAISDSSLGDSVDEEDSAVLDSLMSHLSTLFSLKPTESKHKSLKSHSHANEFSESGLIWPTEGMLTSHFGMRKMGRRIRMHTGIDVGAPMGVPILASADGQVIIAKYIRGYGMAVVLAHDEQHTTLYGHMRRLNVKLGDFVVQGQRLGDVGRTGHATGPHVHFETRVHGEPKNPLSFLPKPQESNIKVVAKAPLALKSRGHSKRAHPRSASRHMARSR